MKCDRGDCLIEAVMGVPICGRSDCAYTLRDELGPARIRASVAVDVIGVRQGEVDTTYKVKRNRQDLLIPGRYVPARVMTLWKAKELTPALVHVAARFCYNEHHLWMVRTIGTNFPRGYKVQTSVRTHTVKIGLSERKPLHYSWLVMLLIEDVPFAVVAVRFGCTGSKRTLHRKGKQLLVKLLEETRRYWAS